MCTVTWAHQPGGYHLLCNRDEKRARGIAAAPRLLDCSGVRYLAPVDADFGGTWIAINQHGLGLCLLNGGPGPSPAEPRSRGVVIRELIWARSMDDASFVLSQLDLAPFAPFTLLLLEPDRPAAVAAWDGAGLALDADGDSQIPLISSSYDAEGVRLSRRNEFGRQGGRGSRVDPAVLRRFHQSHGESPDAYSPCMHRPDAETVSFSWAIVTPRQIRFLYLPAAPCQGPAGEQQIISRAA